MSQTPPSLEGLSLTEKRMLLAELLREKAKERSTFPLSHGQRGLWFLYQLDRESPAYNIFFPARIRTRLDVAAFRRALQTLIDRHPSLRTTFEEKDGELRQHVHEKVPIHFETFDASSWSEEELRGHVEEEAYRPFDLERGPLVRMYLFTRTPQDHVFLLTAHHIVGDFWSLVLLMEEMQSLYPTPRDGAPLALEALTQPRSPGSYRNFVRWQSEMLAGEEGERLWTYWQKQLDGVSPVLELPADRPRPARLTSRGAAVSCRLEAGLIQRLKALAAQEGVTLYTILLAGFKVLLSRYSGQDDFVVGSPFAGRSRSEFERIVGYFINMLPLRAKLSDDPPFRELLHRVGATVLEALEHQDYPFALLVERVNLKRDPSRAPLVQASFTLEKAHRPVGMGCWSFFLPQSEVRLNVGGLNAEPYQIAHRTCQMDLEMVLEEGEGTIYGMMRYNADLFKQATIERLAGHYRILLESAAANPALPISQLPLLTDAEQRQILRQWNDTHVDYPRDLCLHQMFEQQARRTPSAIALRIGEQTLTYAELDSWANRLAHRLHRQGVGPETMVALCLERSFAMIAAILGVLKAGGAYVPLDPSSPTERLRVVVEETKAPILLAQRHLVARLTNLATKIHCLEEDVTGEESDADSPPSSGVQPSNLAYVIYTSGSTGRPKGVMIAHRAIGNTIWWHREVLTVRPDDRLLLLVPYIFDASICIIFPALATGAEVVLALPGEERDPARLLERIQRDAVTILPIPPRLLRVLLDERLRKAGRKLRWVCCGGEAMPPDLPARVFELLDVPLYNLYGPTEVAIDATCYTCQRGEQRPIIPIGRPIGNVQVYVLDQQQRPLPVGVPGELYVGGAGLARGYLNDPQLTSERFIANPFSDQPGARLYRTGDRCRWLADGNLEFLGRLDQQVKLRGYRIEIGEIEAILATHPSVLECAVIIYGQAEDQRLVGYVSARAGAGVPTAELLQRFLRERLPEYMVPATFVLLPSLPHTATGKVDRKALPAPMAERPATRQPFVAPQTVLETFLAGLWRELLGVQQIGVNDNFFELGGNSIQAAMLINRIQEQLSEQIYTIAIFDSPTIRGLTHYLSERCPDTIREKFGDDSLSRPDEVAQSSVGWAESSRPTTEGNGAPTKEAHPTVSVISPLLVRLQSHGARPACFMVHPPGGIVLCYQALAHRLGADRPFYGIRSRGLHRETDLPNTLEAMAAEYVDVIRSVQAEGPYHLGGWSMGGVVAYEMAQQLRAQGQSVGLLALLDTTIPYNAANEPYAEVADQSAREYGLDITLEELDKLGPEEQLPYLWQHVQKLGLVDADTPLPLVQQIMDDLKRLFHAHIQLGSNYALRPYPGPITLFRPLESPVAIDTARDRNWGKLAPRVDVHFVPGQHHTMVKEPHVQELAQKLHACLRQIEDTTEPASATKAGS